MEIKRNLAISLSTIIVFSILFLNCKKQIVVPTPKIPVVVAIKDTSIVNRFIFNGLGGYYLWNDSVPALVNQKYANADSLNRFLNSYSDPQKFFSSLLYTKRDKWSFLVNDSATITNWIQGISETMGYDFMLARIGTSGDVFGFVRYVFKGSPAEKAGIKRGDLFMKVGDTQLTVTNYQTLLFTTMTYTLSMASISGTKISLNGNTVAMTAITMQENPILMDTVLLVNNLKVGYLVYNGFNSDFDGQLNDVFQKFKVASIDKLILDLRYNGGGSVETAKCLASMIYGKAKSSVFLKSEYNAGLQAQLISAGMFSYLTENFTDSITSTKPVQLINTLNLKELYVITTDNTASASELLINGLTPYMSIYSVGTNTVGKYVASMTIKDWIDNNLNVNPKEPYEMQAIVVKISNAAGKSNFYNGLTPDFVVEEDIANLLPFGDPNETLLKPVLDKIKGISPKSVSLKSAQMGLVKVFDTRAERPFAHDMHINHMINFQKK